MDPPEEGPSSVPYSGYPRSTFSIPPVSTPQSYIPAPSYPGSFAYPQPYSPFPPHPAPFSALPGTLVTPSNAPLPATGIDVSGAQINQDPLDPKTSTSNLTQNLQRFINLSLSKTKVQDDERDLELGPYPTSPLKDPHKLPCRIFTMDKERGQRSPLRKILQTRFISPLEQNGHGTITLTVDDETPDEDTKGTMRWM